METVEEYFEWKNNQGEQSLEKKYIKETKKLKWKFTDTLYSFLGIFYVGLKVYCGVNDFSDLKEILNKETQVKSSQKKV